MKRNYVQYLLMVALLLIVAGNSYAQENPEKEILSELFDSEEEPDWKKVHSKIEKEYPPEMADSIAAYTKVQYYFAIYDKKKYTASLIEYGNKHGKNSTADALNKHAGWIFKYGSDKQELQTALTWSKRAVSMSNEKDKNYPNYLNTYANLLYRLGNKKKALQYESKAYSLFSATQPYRHFVTQKGEDGVVTAFPRSGFGKKKKQAMTTLFKMEKGAPTWPVPEEEAAMRRQVTAEEDEPYWQRVKDKWLHREHEPREADSMLYLGKLYHYDYSGTGNMPAYMTAFVDYAGKYGNRTMPEKNNNAWEVFQESDNPKELKKALAWSAETIKDKDNQYYLNFLDTYANLLYKLGKKREALDPLAELVTAGKYNDETTEMLKGAYEEVHHGTSGYAAYLESLKNATYKKALDKMAEKQEEDPRPAPEFTLSNLDGTTVSLDDLKGKIVVIDFWATWCRPCIVSFPGMQQVIDAYKDDPNVQFLFVDVGEEKEVVESWMSKEGSQYTFEILLDRDKSVMKDYGVTGIPAKVIIDRAGNIRFRAKEYDGSDTAVFNNLKAMVELAKQ